MVFAFLKLPNSILQSAQRVEERSLNLFFIPILDSYKSKSEYNIIQYKFFFISDLLKENFKNKGGFYLVKPTT